MKIKKITLIVVIIISMFSPKVLLIYAASFLLFTLWLLDKKVFYMIKNKTMLFLFGVLVLLQPFLLGNKDIILFGLGISSSGLIAGLSMFIRGVLVISAFQIINKTLPKESVFGFWKLIGVSNFTEVFDESKLLFPKLSSRIKAYTNDKNKIKFIITSPLTLIAEVIAATITEAHSKGVQETRRN